MRILSKVAMAVAATFAGGAAFALPPGTTYDVQLRVSGSSAFQGSFKSELATMCSDAVDTYVASVSSGTAPNLQAYSCTLNAASGLAAGTKAIVYYRAEGGSVWGVAPLGNGLSAAQKKVLRLNPTVAGCTGSSPSYSCLVSGFNLNLDTVASGAAISDSVDLGISDIEPSQFVGENWLDSTDGAGKFGALAPAYAGQAPDPAVGQVFAIYVNKSVTGGVAGTPINISKQSLTSIFSGLYTDWSQVPNAAGTGFLSGGAIQVCLRDAGSGTQASASLYFNGMNCSTGAFAFAGSPFSRNASTGSELSCVGNNAGAIGFAAVQSSNPANTSIVNVNGVVPSRINAANGTYDYWYEVTFNKPVGLSGNVNTLANTFIGRMKNAATVPSSSASVFALPSINIPVLPVDSSHPVSLGTRQGNSCFLPQGFN